MRAILVILTAALAAPTLAGCSEKSQTLASAEAQAPYKQDNWNAENRARTLHQGESGRIAY
jgi:hypothetical protein